MTFEGWDEINPYSIEITDQNEFIVYYNGEEVHRSRAFRLRVQAKRKALDWIMKDAKHEPSGGVVLDVQRLSIDIDSIFGGNKNG